ncbi:anaerobic ribonucleoside-triphosphate reductase [Candidatus Avelusimicrobium faecicola]|jgi:anaerobic ribonucleoside-triphosphate reductase|uniref:anaerobic ribonucleoside-triphosphate reductase n=1 Tax=Candidatus Avelusimicrobium faecicola TaxID=3416205 RepID=UPI00159FD405
MKTKAELLKEIAELKKAKANCHGTKCEVYSRVVGYLRPVQGYNKGKKEEYAMRKMYDIEHIKLWCKCS